MNTGRMNPRHVPQELRQNFTRDPTQQEIKVAPGYITNYDGQLSQLERKKSHEQEEKKQIRQEKIKKCIRWLLVCLAILLIVAAVVIAVLYFVTCIFGNCPKGCYDCQYAQGDWRQYRGYDRYSANKRHCGDSIKVQFTDNTFSVDGTVASAGLSKQKVVTTAPLVHSFSEEINGKLTNTFQLYWYMERTVRNNETLKLVFSDNGSRYAGFGDFGKSVFRPKNTATNDHYTLWTDESNPIYLPYYLSRNEHSSVCMFVDVQGSPLDVTVLGAETEWIFYKRDKVYFHIYSDKTPYGALKKCSAKWNELYPSPDASWSDDFILGSLTTDQIKTARETSGILATHYLLSPDSISINSGNIAIKDEAKISNYEKVLLSWSTKQKLKDSGFTLTTANGFYSSDRVDTYILDYDNSKVKTPVKAALSGHTSAGILLQGGVIHSNAKCPQYLYCAVPKSVFHDWGASVCPGSHFGDEEVMFQRHNTYDASRRDALKSGDKRIIESVATPGTTHFYRDVELTEEGLKTCFNNILNLHMVGVRAVTCNMCGGLIPQASDALQSVICDRFSQISLLMPYLIMKNEDAPPFITDSKDAGRYVNNNLSVRKVFEHYLDMAYRASAENDRPFVYPVSAAYNDELYVDRDNGVMIGDSLFFAVVLDEPETGKPITIALPPGLWYSNGGPLLGEVYTGGQEQTQLSTDMSQLIFFRLGTIFVLNDLDNDHHVIVRVFMPYDGFEDPINHDFEYYDPDSKVKHATRMSFDATNERITFQYTSPGSPVTQDIKISTIEVYLWHKDNTNPPNWATFNVLGDNKFNVVLDYIAKGDVKSLFDSWTQNIMQLCC